MRLAVRPQPLGIFPLPAGYLVLPAGDGVAELQSALLDGALPETASTPLRFYLLAASGDRAGALALLAGDETPEGRYNRFVLESDPDVYAELREQLTGDLALLLIGVGYTLGWIDTPPDADGFDGELRAWALSLRAAAALERGDQAAAILDLTAAVDTARPVSPLLAAQLLGDLAEVRWQTYGPEPTAIECEREALRLLAGSSLAEIHAGVALRLGMRYQELARGQRGVLLEAARCYQAALRFFQKESHPEQYALAQSNLALAYLTMPLVEASDQLRMAVAVQALREALSIYTRERYPEQWASAQLNLANALQYLPSSHPQDNLVEAVQRYEELLELRSPAADPLGYARLLANQGNALAHLGIFEHSRAKLQEAAQYFDAAGDQESAATANSLAADVESQMRTGEEPLKQQAGYPG